MTTPEELSKKLGFDTEAFVKPKTIKHLSSILDELMNELTNLNNLLGRMIATEQFSVYTNNGSKHFTQYLDKNDDAHILMQNPNDPDDWVEIFRIDRSYCNFTNKQGVIVGRIKLENIQNDTWVFVTEKDGKKEVVLKCQSKYPYDCEREVIQWMANTNQLDYFINLK